MARNLKELFREASTLPENDRATLSGLLLETLDPQPTPEVKAAWSREIKRRVREIDEGRVKGIPHEEVMAHVREKLNRARRRRKG